MIDIEHEFLGILQDRCARVSRQFAPRVDPEGRDILGAVYIVLITLAKKDPAILADAPRFRATVDSRARWECLQMLRDTPWGGHGSDSNTSEGY